MIRKRLPWTPRRSVLAYAGLLFALVACLTLARPSIASASIGNAACSAVGDANGLAGRACNLLNSPGKLLGAGKNLITGHFGSALKSFFGGGGGGASTASTALGLAAIVTWVVTGAKFALSETMKILGQTTTPQLRSTWFSSTYWRIAGIAALLTLPFLFAAAVQALMRSELALLTHAALGYLPLALLAVAIAAPLTMLLLAATDQLCSVVSSAAGAGSPHTDLVHALLGGAVLTAASVRAPFLLFLLGALTTGGAIVLWLELAIREAAVYVVVLMLPLAFGALVWPARRIWAVRALELLVALILSKLAIVAVLELGGAALDQLGHHGFGGLTAGLAGTVLVILAALSPWAVLRLVPLSELASGAAGSLRPAARGGVQEGRAFGASAGTLLDSAAGGLAARMRRQNDETQGASGETSRGAESEIRRLGEQSEPAAVASSNESEGSAENERSRDDGRAFAARSAPGNKTESDGFGPGRDVSDPGGDGSGHEEPAEDWSAWPHMSPSKDGGALVLGSDENWPNPRPWGEPETTVADESPSETVAAEDRDPLPPAQESDEGRL